MWLYAKKISFHTPELLIRGGNEDSEIFFLFFLNKNIYCDPLLDLSGRDVSNEGYNIGFCGKNKKKYMYS